MDLFDDLPDPGDVAKSENGNKDKTDASQTNIAEISNGNPPSLPATSKLTVPLLGHESERKRSLKNLTEQPSEKRKKEFLGSEKVLKDFESFSLKGFVVDRQGEREEMQDAHLIIDDLLSFLSDTHPSLLNCSLHCVFDGHGGTRASRFASKNLHNNLRDRFPKGDVYQVEKEIKKTIIDSFKRTDEEFLKEATKNKPSWKDGSTAVTVLAINSTLYIANLGDSKAVLGRYKESEAQCVGISLTSDHNPSIYDERMRIQKAGGWVKDGRVMGQLEVSRSIGDGPYKNHGVSCVPDIKRCRMTDNDRFIIIACDGLWKSFTPDESVKFVNTILQDESIQGSGKKTNEEVRFETACSKLANTAVLKLSGDNVTVLIVSIQKAKANS